MTCNCFELLTQYKIPNHFKKRCAEKDTFLAIFVSMIPIEIVVRQISFGSYLLRNLGVAEGTILDPLVVELFYKDNKRNDPIMTWSKEKHCFELYNSKKPISQETFLGDLCLITPGCSLFGPKEIDIIYGLGVKAFEVLRQAWLKQDVTLVDLKIECGWVLDGTIIIADVIDNDSWRIWIGGDKEKMMDKQLYRDGKDLLSVQESYAWVASATDKFLT